MRLDIVKKRNVGFAKMLYDQRRYQEAEIIIKDNLVNAEAKYLMGKICLKKNEVEEAKVWFDRAINNNYKWIKPRIALARIWIEEGFLEKAEREYDVCMKREPKNAELKLEVAKFYITKDDTEKAKKLVEKAIRLKPNNEKIIKKALEIQDRMQNYDAMYDICEELRETNLIKPNEYKIIETMARTYFNLEKYDKVLETFRGKTTEPTNRIMENLYKRRIYCKLCNNEEQASMYQTILSNLEEAYGEEGSLKHIEKHLRDNKTKDIHGVFTKSLPEILEKIKNSDKVKQKGVDCDIYCIKIDECGYQGGNKGDGHTLNYVTLITMPDTHKPITLFPSDEIRLRNLGKTIEKEEIER